MKSIMLELELEQLYTNHKELNEPEVKIIERELLKQLLDMYDKRHLDN